jgi:hypothetical protein
MFQKELDTSYIPYGDMLYRFALNCAEHKIRNTCGFNCRVCPSNISKYAIDPQTATMLQHSAELEMQHRMSLQHKFRMEEAMYAKAKSKSHLESIVWILITILIFGLFFCWVWRPKDPQIRPPVTDVTPTAIKEDLVRMTLERIYNIDMNHDGLINCIDYTIQFYNIYPERGRNIEINWNQNPETGWSHLFIWLDGEDIEPGAYLLPNNPMKKILVTEVWGAKYDPKYSRNATKWWLKIRDGTFVWGNQWQ